MWPRSITAAAVLALAGCAVDAPTPAEPVYNKDGSVTVTIAAERVAECAKFGGCGLYSQAELEELAEAAATLSNKACLRPAPSSL